MGYIDEKIWSHLFLLTLDDLPKKWYKMEEEWGETFLWNEIKENFIKDFKFIPEDDQLVEATKQIETFIKPTIISTSTETHNSLNASCHNTQLIKYHSHQDFE